MGNVSTKIRRRLRSPIVGIVGFVAGIAFVAACPNPKRMFGGGTSAGSASSTGSKGSGTGLGVTSASASTGSCGDTCTCAQWEAKTIISQECLNAQTGALSWSVPAGWEPVGSLGCGLIVRRCTG